MIWHRHVPWAVSRSGPRGRLLGTAANDHLLGLIPGGKPSEDGSHHRILASRHGGTERVSLSRPGGILT